jgi:hypothetical protein
MPMVQEAGWSQSPVWTVEENLTIGIRSPDLPGRSELQFRMRCPLSLPILKRSQVARQLGLGFYEVVLSATQSITEYYFYECG